MTESRRERRRRKHRSKKTKNGATSRQEPQVSRPPSGITHKWLLTEWPKPSLVKIVSSLGTVCLALLAFYQYSPSWTLDLPSSSFRPNNPFTAVFTITNTGLLPATHVSVKCVQQMIEYSEPSNTFSSGPAPWATARWVSRNDKLSALCEQIIAGIKIYPRILSLEEMEELRWERPPLDENPHVIWADLVFTIRYAPIFFIPQWQWTEWRRVKGEPGEDGTFVWMQVPVDHVYHRPSYEY